MLLKSALGFVFIVMTVFAHALSPRPEFTIKDKFGAVTAYEISGKDVEINGMGSEFTYDDLTEKDLKKLKDLLATKQEYGKVFGFHDWKASSQKLIEKNGERIVLIQGTYKDAKNRLVNFIEVYWASKVQSGQYLITSNSLPLKIENYTEYLK